MHLSDQRALALGAVRSQLRSMSFDPVTVSAEDAHRVLDDLARHCPDLVACQWYASASSYQMQLFYVEWERWRRGQEQPLHVSNQFQQNINRLFPLE
jgi:hypothetical protein